MASITVEGSSESPGDTRRKALDLSAGVTVALKQPFLSRFYPGLKEVSVLRMKKYLSF